MELFHRKLSLIVCAMILRTVRFRSQSLTLIQELTTAQMKAINKRGKLSKKASLDEEVMTTSQCLESLADAKRELDHMIREVLVNIMSR